MSKLNYKVASSIYSKITDGTHDSPKQQIIGKPLITSKHIKGRNIDFDSAYLISEIDYIKINERSQVEKWDVIISMIGEYCGFSYIERNDNIDYAVKNVGLFKTGSKLEAEWLYYYLNSPIGRQHLNFVKSGSSQPYLTLGGLRNLPILQAKDFNSKLGIVKVLSDLDTKIELNNKINAELEAMAKTLYDYWFVQFDFPDANGKPYKTSGGKMVWNEELSRDIPEEWEVKELGNELSIQRGISYKSSEIKGDGISMISLNSFNLDGTYKPEGIKKYSGKYAEKNLISEGDLLIAITDVTRNADIIGKAIIVPDYYSDLVISMDIAKVIPNKKLTESYLMMLFNSNHYHNYIKWYASGTIVLHLNLDGMFWYKAEIPTKELLYEFDKIYKPISKRIAETKKQNQELASLRDWLLPMLMNGQVKVGEVEEELGMVAESGVEYQVNLSDKDKKIRRKMLATYIINQSLSDISFGKTKFEKLLHLIECHIVKGDYNQKYSVQAAGPYDGGFTKIFWNEVTKSKWFKIEEFGRLKRIMPAENHSKSLVDYGFLSEDLRLMINNFIAEFKNTNYERPEIISTLYAVWNNRIIRNEMITDELLKKDFLEWDEQKARYEDRLDNALIWMHENEIIPNGWGREIRRAKK